jgi:hypothetical protein
MFVKFPANESKDISRLVKASECSPALSLAAAAFW